MSETDEYVAFADALLSHRNRLSELLQDSPAITDALSAEIDELGQHLLVADEELRVQTEQLREATHALDAVVANYEYLFGAAPIAYLHTDADGVLVRINRTAAALLWIPGWPKRRYFLPSLFVAGDRVTIRSMISRIRRDLALSPTGAIVSDGAAAADAADREPRPVEAALRGVDRSEVPVFVLARSIASPDVQRQLLHWELRPRRIAVTEAAALRRAIGAPTEWHRERDESTIVAALTAALAEVTDRDSPEATVEAVAEQTLRTVNGCDHVGVMLVRSQGRLESLAATSALAAGCDQLQHRIGKGPGLAAMEERGPIIVDDMASERRWHDFCRRAASFGVGSMLSVPLALSRSTVGTLNLYSNTVRAFDGDAVLVANALGTQAAVAIANKELETNLRAAISTRQGIGQAVGILMERHRVSASQAFDMLVYISQHTHRKLRDIAKWVTETGEDLDALMAAPPPEET